MVSFPPVSPQRPSTPPSPHPYAPHAQPISFFSILSPVQYWVRITNHLAPRYAISSIPPLPFLPRSIYSPQHHVLKHPQLPFLPQCQLLSFTPIQNNRQNYSSIKILSTRQFKTENFEIQCPKWRTFQQAGSIQKTAQTNGETDQRDKTGDQCAACDGTQQKDTNMCRDGSAGKQETVRWLRWPR